MSTSDWPRAEPALERYYRRLLRAYPRPYRRRHGAEMVTTLLEMAEPGQRRPGLADSWHLVAAGIRQRFRLPRRPLAWIAAALALLAGGALGAAGGSWAAEKTFTSLPGHGQALSIHWLATGQVGEQVSVNTFSGAPISGPDVHTVTRVAGGWNAAQAQARLAADGWRPASGDDLTMTRDGLQLRVTVLVDTAFTSVRALDNGSWRPLTALGVLLGAMSGWLVAAAVAQRRSRPAAVAGALTLAALAVPVWALYDNTVAGFQHPGLGFTAHSVLEPSRFWPYGPLWLNIALVAAGLLLAAITVVLAAARPGPDLRTVPEVAS